MNEQNLFVASDWKLKKLMIDTFSFLLHDFKIGFTNEWSVCMHLRGDWRKTKLNWNDNGLFKCIGRLPPECKLFRKCWRSERSWIYSGLWSNIYNSNLSFQIIHDDRCLIGESIGCVVSLHHFVSPILFVRVGHKCSLFVFFQTLSRLRVMKVQPNSFWEVRNVLWTRYFCVWLCWTNEWTLNNLNPWKSKNQENITCDNKNNEWWHLNCFWIFICFQETFLSFIFILTAALFEFFIDLSFTFFSIN